MATVEIENLSHCYKRHAALSDVCLRLDNGIVALIGPNGAGKTTLINCLCGLLRPTQGKILFNGQDIRDMGQSYYAHIAYCPQNLGFYPHFTVYEFLLYMSDLKGIPRSAAKQQIEELLELVNLMPQKKQKIRTLSGGMKQRLGIAQTLLAEPDVIVFDEPTAGLDPNERIRFKKCISRIALDRLVIIATHIISDVEDIASRIVLLKSGKIVVNQPPKEALEPLEHRVWEIPDVSPQDLYSLSRTGIVSNLCKTPAGNFHLRLICDSCPAEKAAPAQADLEDVFLYYFQDTKDVIDHEQSVF